jgi:hypothetical protein
MDTNGQASDEPTMLERLEELEAQARTYRRVGILAFLLLIACVVILKLQAVEASRRMTIERLGLVDGSGRERAVLTVTEAGPRLVLYGAQGQPLAALEAAEGGSALTLHAADGRPRVEAHAATKAPALRVRDASGRDRVRLGIDGGAPHVRLYDGAGSKRTALAVGENGAGLLFVNEEGRRRAWLGELLGASRLELYDAAGRRRTLLDVPAGPSAAAPIEHTVRAERFELVDQAGRVRAELGVQADGEMGLFLYPQAGRQSGRRSAGLSLRPDGAAALAYFEGRRDGEARCRAHFGLSHQGSPFLMLHNTRAQPRAWLEVDANGQPHLSLFDRDGKRIWKAP